MAPQLTACLGTCFPTRCGGQKWACPSFLPYGRKCEVAHLRQRQVTKRLSPGASPCTMWGCAVMADPRLIACTKNSQYLGQQQFDAHSSN
jgi:hypothetical protein